MIEVKKLFKRIFLITLCLLMSLSAFACGKTKQKDNDDQNELPEPQVTWPLDGLMLSSKKTSRRLATVDVTPMVTDWSNAKYFAIQVYQPSPYAWAFQLSVHTSTGMTNLTEDAQIDSKDYTHNYTLGGAELWDLQVYFASAFTIPAAIVNGGAHWIVVPRAVLGLDGEGITSSSVHAITCRLDISDYNAGIQIIFGKMMIFNEEINETFSNGITVFDSAGYDDETFWGMYSLHTYDTELHDDFDEYINKRRIVKGEEIA